MSESRRRGSDNDGNATSSRRAGSDDRRASSHLENWNPRTKLGRMVKDGEITSIQEIFLQNKRIQDIEIVDTLVPGLEETILDVKRVQRQTDAGRKTAFQAIAAVGNRNGIIGVASGKDVGMGTAIRNAIKNAKLSIIPVKRGCGSWECACHDPHSIPVSVEGHCASVSAKLLPAPRGLGLVTGEAAKKVLKLAGIQDVWSRTSGDTRTTSNYVKAVFEALKATYYMQNPADW
ncbi:MAG: 30S ribosomal protein S5 [Candidatus Thorarchaeota archaeon]